MSDAPSPDESASLTQTIRLLRKTLGWSQAKLAGTIGIDQTTVSQYEIGRAVPPTEVLIKMSALAPNKGIREAIGRQLGHRFNGFWEETFFALPESDKKAFINAFMQPPRRRFMFDLTEVLGRPEAPEFLREIISLYLRFKKHPDAERTFEQAVAWLRVQFQMLDYEEKIGSDADAPGAAYTTMVLREHADEPLVRTRPITRPTRVPKTESKPKLKP
ncbi:MAG TPA: helix-turn-helix transcriptional regulator [Acidobacteriaceae bacterium]|nr:helix-turn-helix transcriptional regulator [Acidobacteriaceae bacterium]